MRKSVLLIMMLFAVSMAANAQKFALIDTEYIMKNIPAAQSANEQMQEATKKYQSEVEALAKEAQKMFQDYQAKSSTFSAAQKTKTEDAIVAKEKEAAELKRNYFGPEGELAKMRDKLITPIQDDIYEAVKDWDEPVAIAVLPDHPTPCELRTHTSDPIPFLIWYPGIEPDEVQMYDEIAACNGSYGLLKEDEFIKEFMK